MDQPKKGKYSAVWNFFEVIDRYNAKCKICKGNFSYRSTTSNLRKHVERKHATLKIIGGSNKHVNSETADYAPSHSQIFHITSSLKKEEKQGTPQQIQIKLIPTQVINQPIKSQMHSPTCNIQNSDVLKEGKNDNKSAEDETNCNANDALMQMLIKDFHSIDIVEEEGFRSFVASLNPHYEIPSKKLISQTLLPAMYERCLENVRDIIGTIKSACVTTECWTSYNNESYLATTVHFIDNDFYLKSVLLNCSLLEENFTSESLANELNRVINEWDLQDRIVFSVSSGEEYIASAFELLENWEHFGCFVHSVNKIMWEALSLKPIEELICKVRQVVSFFKNDPMASSELQLSQIHYNIEPKKLKQDNPMMWNTTYYMVERFVELENAISCTVTIQESNLPLIQPDEWTVLKELAKILKSLEAITKAADQENYMLASLPIVLANGLFEICRKLECCVDLTDLTKVFVMKLKNGFSTRFSKLIDNPILSACTFLDPRFKTIPFANNEGAVKKRVIDLLIKKMNIDKKKEIAEDQETTFQSQNIEELSVWEMFDKSAANTKLEVSISSRAQLEVERFIEDDLINRNSDPLEWWRTHRYNYPHLSEVVVEIFCSLASSVPCSRMFTKAGNILMDRRSKLSACKLRQLAFLNTNEHFLNN